MAFQPHRKTLLTNEIRGCTRHHFNESPPPPPCSSINRVNLLIFKFIHILKGALPQRLGRRRASRAHQQKKRNPIAAIPLNLTTAEYCVTFPGMPSLVSVTTASCHCGALRGMQMIWRVQGYVRIKGVKNGYDASIKQMIEPHRDRNTHMWKYGMRPTL